jgi:hypothetical protein
MKEQCNVHILKDLRNPAARSLLLSHPYHATDFEAAKHSPKVGGGGLINIIA